MVNATLKIAGGTINPDFGGWGEKVDEEKFLGGETWGIKDK